MSCPMSPKILLIANKFFGEKITKFYDYREQIAQKFLYGSKFTFREL